MEGKKEFLIEINGIKQSIDAVSALKKMLDELSQSIDALNAKTISVGQGELGQTTDAVPQVQETEYNSRAGALREEKTILEEIEKVEQKIVETQSEQYQQLIDAKNRLKEYKQIAESAAAATKNEEGMFDTNTLQGMKDALKSIKQEMQTLDIGSERFKELTAQANGLNEKLKSIEQSYGQFGRNVGNYASAFNEVKKITVTIGDTERTFNSVREASRELNQELKAMVINGQENTKEFEELSDAVHKFEMASKRAESAVNDLKTSSSGMDNMLDMFESFTALGSISQGISGFFGINDDEIQRSIQKLVSLQNVLQGIEKIRQQMNTKEGIGSILAKGNASIDNFVAKITNAEVGVNGLTKSTKSATVAVRGLSAALKGLTAVFAIIAAWVVNKAFDKITSQMSKAEMATEQLEMASNSLNKSYENRAEQLTSSYLKSAMSNENYLVERFDLENEKMKEQITLLRRRADIMNDKSWWDNFSNMMNPNGGTTNEFNARHFQEGTTVGKGHWMNFSEYDLNIVVNNIKDVETEFNKCNEAIEENKDYLSKWGSGLKDWINSLLVTVTDTKEAMLELGNIRLSDFIASIYDVSTAADKLAKDFQNDKISLDEYKKKTKEVSAEIGNLKKEMDDNKVLSSVIANLDLYIPDEKVREKVQNIIGDLRRLDDAYNVTSAESVRYWAQVDIDAMEDGVGKIKAQIEADKKYEISQHVKTYDQLEKINKKYRKRERDEIAAYNKKNAKTNKSSAKAREEVERQLNQLLLRIMKDGMSKRLAQLDNEHKETIKKLKENGKLTIEEQKKIDAAFLKLRQDTIKEWMEQLKDSLKGSAREIANIKFDIDVNTIEYSIDRLENKIRELESDQPKINSLFTAAEFKGYNITDDKRLSNANNYLYELDEAKVTGNYQKFYTRLIEFMKAQNIEVKSVFLDVYNTTEGTEQQKQEAMFDKIQKYYEEEYSEEISVLKKYSLYFSDEMKKNTLDLEKSFEMRRTIQEKYNDEYLNEVQRMTKIISKNEEERAKLIYENSNNEENRRYEESQKNLKKQKETIQYEIDNFKVRNESEKAVHEQLKVSLQEINTQIEKDSENHYNKLDSIYNDYLNTLKKNELDSFEQISSVTEKGFDAQLANFREFITKMNDVIGSQPKYNSWNIVNIGQTRKELKEIENAAEYTLSSIEEDYMKLTKAFEMGLITPEAFNEIKSQLAEMEMLTKGTLTNVNVSMNESIGDFINSVNFYVQAVGQAMSQLLTSIADYEDSIYQKRMEELNEWIEFYENKMNEQEEIAEEHKNKIEEIEGDISTSRGDRRDRLIDQLNEEIYAQRRAVAEKRKAEKEMQKLEKQKEKEELEQKKKEHKRAIVQAIISAALATANGLATQPFVPVGIAMGALAASLGAAQVALIASQKYAEGGVIEGKSHAQGGVKVLGGRAEVEGGEFITNKVTTTKNVELLEFINSKKKKIKLDDLMEFYSDERHFKKNISVVRTKFADGGIVPTLRTDIDINDRLVTAMEDYAQRPVQVAVVDIIDRTQQVNEVKVLAGLNVD